jgi:hypothetical protein
MAVKYLNKNSFSLLRQIGMAQLRRFYNNNQAYLLRLLVSPNYFDKSYTLNPIP